MYQLSAVDRDILDFAEYWGARKARWIDAASSEFEEYVHPFAMRMRSPLPRYLAMTNIYFTEWALFERPLIDGRTPLQLYIEQSARTLPEDSLDRMRQVERTQFFSRFSIVEKDVPSSSVRLVDVWTGSAYEVLDPVICSTERWREGTIAERIACVDGIWCPVGQARLYDCAPVGQSIQDDLGEPRDVGAQGEEAGSYYLHLLRDVIGVDGRFSNTLKLVEVDPEADLEPAPAV